MWICIRGFCVGVYVLMHYAGTYVLNVPNELLFKSCYASFLIQNVFVCFNAQADKELFFV